MLSRKSQKLVKNVVCLVAVLSGSLLASQVNAETFQIGGFGLNTNNNFSRIDGQPKMSSWQHNPNDNDQQFDQVRGNRGGMMLKHRSTGKCVNAYRGNGSEFNVWPCNANDGDQNWNIINLGGGKVQLQKVGTNLCIDMPERRNYGRVHMIVCDRNNGNQQWVSSSQTPPPQTSSVIIKPTTNRNLEFYKGQQWVTSNGYKFVFQGDGNLVLYSPSGQPLWATGSERMGATGFAVQTDGNIVLYASGKAIWASNTAGNPGAYLAIQTDGNVVVYNSANNPLFNTNTAGGRNSGVFNAAALWQNQQRGYYPNIETTLKDFFKNKN
ncbi:MAG TPA: ricin-type beta-trefoil lectin domain protein, partial [Allocoleopsis sp.]